MSTICERTKKTICMVGVVMFVIIPVEGIRTISTFVSMLPLTLFSAGEYIFSGKQENTERLAYNIEFGDKEQVEKLAKESGFESKIY